MDIVEQARNLIANEPVYDTLTVKGLVSEIERLRQYISELEDAIASNNPTEIFNKSARLEGLLTALKGDE